MAESSGAATATQAPPAKVSAYTSWIQSTGVPVHRGYFVEDLRTLELGRWDERECNAAFLELAGQEGVSEARDVVKRLWEMAIAPGNEDVALGRFAPMLSSQDFAAAIQQLQHDRAISADTRIMLYGDQADGSSIPFYLGQQVLLVEGRSTSMLFGSTFADAPPIFLTDADLVRGWGNGPRGSQPVTVEVGS